MASPLFKAMYNSSQNRGLDVVQSYNQFQQNPFAFIMQRRGIDIPEDCRNNPQKAVQYLIDSGQMSKSELDGLLATAKRIGIQLNL